MYIVCKDCEQQYDIGEMAPGSKFLCRCGRYVRVPSVTVKDAVINRCPSCGAALAAGAKGCAYCGSEISLAELSLGEACPKCLSRMFKGAKYCSTCGLAIHTEMVGPAHELRGCPRCETPTLVVRRIEGGTMTECTKCSGIWLGTEFFDRIVEEKDEKAMGVFTTAHIEENRHAIDPEAAGVRYLLCPVCGERMNRKNFGRASGVIIDWCRNHGYWFDPFELERIFDFVREGGLDKARRRQIEDMRDELRRTENLRSSQVGSPGAFDPFLMEGGGTRLRSGDVEELLGDVVGGIGRALRRLFGR